MLPSMTETRWLSLITLLLILLLVAPAAFSRTRRRGPWLVHAAVWLVVLAALVYAYETFGPFR